MAVSSYSASNVLFHIETQGGVVYTFGKSAYNKPLYDNVYAEQNNGLFGMESFKTNMDTDTGYMYLHDNPLAGIYDTGEATISYWVYLDNPKSKLDVNPFSVYVYDGSTGYKISGYSSVGEFKLTKYSFLFYSSNHYTGSQFSELLIPGQWNHIALTFKCDTTGADRANRMILYVNGEPYSILYTKSGVNASSNLFLSDFIKMTASGTSARWEFPGYSMADSYRMTDFTVLNKVIYDGTKFEVPTASMINGLGLSLTQWDSIGYNTTSPTGGTTPSGSNTGTNPTGTHTDGTGSTTDTTTIKYFASYFDCRMAVNKLNYSKELFTGKINVTVDSTIILFNIPFPYAMFTDIEFFVTKMDGTLVPEYYYSRVSPTQIKFNSNAIQISAGEQIRFTFCHKHEFYAVRKFEQSIETNGSYEYQFNSPYDNVVNLQKRVRVFYDRRFLYPDMELYKFDSDTGKIKFNSSFNMGFGHLISFLCFYTGTKQNDKTISKLPMSGYIEFNRKYVDRIYDKDLFATFVNGKLVSKDKILDISSTIHKISTDIKTRNDLQVLNMSPRLNFFVPYLKMGYTKKKVATNEFLYEFPCTLKVYYPDVYHERYYINPNILNPVEYQPMIPDNLDYYITLLHHGLNDSDKKNGVAYTINYFRDNYKTEAEAVKVIAQLRLKGNEEEFFPDSPTAVLLGTIGPTMTSNYYDKPLLTIQASTIFNADTTYNGMKDSIDGIMCRMEINPISKDNYHRVFYELNTTYYERDTEVGIFEWVISDKPEGMGNVYYRKTIYMHPCNDVSNWEYDSDE
jgi:hypothetical protein